MKAEKLPSGRWRVKVYLGTDDNGKRLWKSITKNTRKEALAEAIKLDIRKNALGVGKVQDLCEKYIAIKEGVLSPSTVRNYKGYMKRISGTRLGRTDLMNVDSALVQKWVSEMAQEVSPKTVRNVFGLFSAMASVYAPGLQLNVKMPQKIKQRSYVPSSEDITKILDYFKDDRDMTLAILLAACGSMRRGEICAIRSSDVEGNMIYVSKDMVKDGDGNWVVKDAPKTAASFRGVPYPKQIIDMIPQHGPVISITPDMLTNRFARAVKKLGMEGLRFHDLRHYWCTAMLYAGVPMKIVQDIGGWETDSVMKEIYYGVIKDEKKAAIDMMTGIFEKQFSKSFHECSTESI